MHRRPRSPNLNKKLPEKKMTWHSIRGNVIFFAKGESRSPDILLHRLFHASAGPPRSASITRNLHSVQDRPNANPSAISPAYPAGTGLTAANRVVKTHPIALKPAEGVLSRNIVTFRISKGRARWAIQDSCYHWINQYLVALIKDV